MFEKFTSGDAQNFRQRYINTFGFFRQQREKRLLVKINRIDTQVGFVDKDGISYSLNPDSENDVGFEFLPPKAGWHNTTDGGWLIRRRASRQWQRGICENNTSITTPRGMQAAVGFDMLSQIYENRQTLSESLKRFNQEKKYDTGFLAISEQFALCKPTKQVFCYETAIGKFEAQDQLFKIVLEDLDMWKTEIGDAARRIDLEVEIA